MADTSVSQFANELGLQSGMLLEQLQAAGIKRALKEDTVLTEQDKTQLLDYLRRVHGAKETKSKITLTRRQTTEIKKSDGSGKARTIQVEVRKKRVLVKREKDAAVEAPQIEVAPQVEEQAAAPKAVDADQVALREEEARKQAELSARQAAELAEKQEKQEKRKRSKDAKEEKPVEAEAKAPAETPAEPASETPAAGVPVTAKKAATDGTLHKPSTKPGASKPKEKSAKKPATAWKDESGKRRGLKTRGAVPGGGDGWHTRGMENSEESMRLTNRPRPLSRLSAKCWCPKPLPLPIWPTRCPSRPQRSSRS
jgi:translation initiation factor IF-2